MSASKDMIFHSKFKDVGSFAGESHQVKAEPMFFNSSVAFAMEHGGPITKSFLSNLPGGWGAAVFDSRVHMLMPGWYPAIPGFHHDDIPRPPIPVGQHFATAPQPDYDNPRYHAEHILGLVNGGICPTTFAVGIAKVSAVPDGLIYRKWDAEVREQIQQGTLVRVECPSNKLINFDAHAFHEASKANGNGWRWFGRVSRNTDRQNTITNEIRTQVQVYLEFPMEGW